MEQRNYIKRISKRQSGYEYEILAFDDYQLLKHGIDILDRILENIKAEPSSAKATVDKYNGKSKDNCQSSSDLHTSFTSASQIKAGKQTVKN